MSADTSPRATVSPAPTDEEAAAIAAALSMAIDGGSEGEARRTPRWRFSGRWWTKPVPARRARP